MSSSMRTALTRGVAILAATAAVVVSSATRVEADPGPGPTGPPMACPHGLPDRMTLEQALVRYAGYFTEERIRAGFDLRDANDNGYFCYRLAGPTDLFYPLVIFLPVDDFEGASPG